MVQIEITGLNRLIKLGNQYPEVSEKYINKAIARSLVRILGKEKQEAPVNTGNLRDNWDLNTGRFTGYLRSRAPYAKDLHEGLPLSQFPSGEQLKPWAAKRGLNPWAVAKAIKKRGHLIANPFFQRALSGVEKEVNAEFQNAITDILKELNKLTD